jgi:hypothetical protein
LSYSSFYLCLFHDNVRSIGEDALHCHSCPATPGTGLAHGNNPVNVCARSEKSYRRGIMVLILWMGKLRLIKIKELI